MSTLKDTLKARLIKDAEFLGVPVKVKLLTAKEKSEFTDQVTDSNDNEKTGELLAGMACSLVLDTETSEPIFTLDEMSGEMSDADAKDFLFFAFRENCMDMGSAESAQADAEKN